MDPIVTDLRREVDKARETLLACLLHLSRHAEANAALHCADRVMYSPLHAKVEAAVAGISGALARTKEPNIPTLDSRSSDGPWAALCSDLDRCIHGRHWGDDCGSCGGTSTGNPHLRPNHVIGYGLRGEPIIMPDRGHKHDPAAWRLRSAPAAPETSEQSAPTDWQSIARQRERELKATGKARHAAEAALARVRAECDAIGTSTCNATTRILAALDGTEPTS
jgi:hypothetical protein